MILLSVLATSFGCGNQENKGVTKGQGRFVQNGQVSNDAAGTSASEGRNETPTVAREQDERLYERLQYSLMIETEAGNMMEEAFEDDEHAFLSGASVGGFLLVYVNDSPIRVHCLGSSVFPIFDFLVPGKNQVQIEGKHPERMFIKVLTVNPKSFNRTFNVEEVLAKTWFDPSQESATLEFNANIAKGPDYEELPSDPEAVNRLRQEMRGLISHWVACCQNHDADLISKSWVPDLKSPPPYLNYQSMRSRLAPFLKDIIGTGRYELLTKAEDVRLVIGKRSVLVYTERKSDQTARHADLFEFKAVDKSVDPASAFFQPATLVRLEGKWVGVR